MLNKYNPNLKNLARVNRKSGNLAEVLLWNQIKAKKLGFTFNRQKPIGNYIADFLCKDLMLIIEIDGYSHEFNNDMHTKREEYLKSQGYHLLRYNNEDVLKNIEGVVESIKQWIAENK